MYLILKRFYLDADGGQRQQVKGVAMALARHLEKMCENGELFTPANEPNKPMQELMQSMSYEPSGMVYSLDYADRELFYVKRRKIS